MQARQGAAIQKMFGSGIAKRIPRGVVAVGKRKFSIWATTPALRATPPVPGGEPEFETDPLSFHASTVDADLPSLNAPMNKYRDRPMDLADATLVHIAERHSINLILTIDHNDFETYGT